MTDLTERQLYILNRLFLGDRLVETYECWFVLVDRTDENKIDRVAWHDFNDLERGKYLKGRELTDKGLIAIGKPTKAEMTKVKR